MLKIAVCDDDTLALKNTARLISAWSEQSGIPTETQLFTNGDELLAACSLTHIHLVFLDILMPLLSGIDAARELRQQSAATHIVFLTASPEFALDAFGVKAQGYLLKPISQKALWEALDDCSKAVNTEPPHLLIKSGFGYRKLYFQDIEYIEAQNKQVLLYLRTGDPVIAVETLYNIEQACADGSFFKCHRSYLIYLPNVDRFSSTQVITKSGKTVPIARGCAKAFKEAYFALMFHD
jgi:DNA-binding LytR/AlgR family response regulator